MKHNNNNTSVTICNIIVFELSFIHSADIFFPFGYTCPETVAQFIKRVNKKTENSSSCLSEPHKSPAKWNAPPQAMSCFVLTVSHVCISGVLYERRSGAFVCDTRASSFQKCVHCSSSFYVCAVKNKKEARRSVICIKSYAPAVISWQPANRNVFTHQSKLLWPRVGQFTHNHSGSKAAKHRCCWKARSHHPGLHLCLFKLSHIRAQGWKTVISSIVFLLAQSPAPWGFFLHCAPCLAHGTCLKRSRQHRAQLYSIFYDKWINPWV